MWIRNNNKKRLRNDGEGSSIRKREEIRPKQTDGQRPVHQSASSQEPATALSSRQDPG